MKITRKPVEPAIWQHKKTKKKFRVLPWWECLEPLVDDKELGTKLTEGRKFKIGSLVQIGWMLENEHGVWLGVGPQAEKAFKEVKK